MSQKLLLTRTHNSIHLPLLQHRYSMKQCFQTTNATLQAYEARLNPFVEFQQHETESHVNKLNLHDRALLSGSRQAPV